MTSDRDAREVTFELADEVPVRAPAPAAPVPPPPPPAVAPPPAARAPIAPPEHAPEPAPRIAEAPPTRREPIAVDPTSVLRVAAYGPPPRGWFEAGLYAWTVFTRRRALQTALAERRQGLQRAQGDEAAALAHVVERARDALGHGASELLAPLQAFDDAAAGREQALQALRQQFDTDRAAIDVRLAELDRERSAAAARAAEADGVAEARAMDRARGDARVKRAEIELRGAHEAARQAAGPNARFAPPEHAARIATLEAERAQRSAELAALTRALDEASAVARSPRDALREIDRRIEAAKQERERLDRTATHHLDVGSQSVRQAGDARLAAYALAGRELLARSGEAIAREVRDAAKAAARQVTAAETDVEVHTQALAAFDRDGLRRGLVVVGIAAGLALILLVLVVRAALR